MVTKRQRHALPGSGASLPESAAEVSRRPAQHVGVSSCRCQGTPLKKCAHRVAATKRGSRPTRNAPPS